MKRGSGFFARIAAASLSAAFACLAASASTPASPGSVAAEPAAPDGSGLYCVATGEDSGERWGFIDATGREAIALTLGYAQPFSEGLAVVARVSDELYGYIDPTGRMAIPYSFQDARSFRHGYAAAKQKGAWGVIDRSGAWVLEPRYRGLGVSFSLSGGRPVIAFQADSGKWGFVDPSGLVAIPPAYDSTEPFAEDRAVVQSGTGYFYIDPAGARVGSSSWSVLRPLRDGRGLARDAKGLWLFVDAACEPMSKDRWSVAREFHDGAAYVWAQSSKGSSFGWIRPDGSWFLKLSGPVYQGWAFSEGLARVMNQEGASRYGLMDRKGALVVPCKYRYLGAVVGGRASFKDDSDLYGILDAATGKVLVPARFTWILYEGKDW
jgi:hypothetical protein